MFYSNKFFFKPVFVGVCVCKLLSQAESLQTTRQGASDPFLDLPSVCVFAALQLPCFSNTMPNSWLKEVDMASPVLHTFGLARTLRGFRSCFGHISKHMAKTL